MQGGETVKLNEVLYVPQALKNILSVSRLVSKVSKMGSTKDNTTIKKEGVSMKLYERKGINESTVFHLKVERYPPEGSSPQEAKKKCQRKRKFKMETTKNNIGERR